MKVFLSIDIEGVNGICSWDETEANHPRYREFKEQLQREVSAACRGAIKAGATEIVVKDAHDSARNLSILDLPKEVKLLRGWEGCPCSMMAGLDSTYDAVIFIGYHSASRSNGNPLSHTMNTSRVYHVKINGQLASEFTINSLYASYLGVPVAFLSGDLNLTNVVKEVNPNIKTVATKEGRHGAVLSKHPLLTCEEIEAGVEAALKENLKEKMVPLPKEFKCEVQYKKHNDAFNASFFPGAKQTKSDAVEFNTNNYYDALVAFKFIL